MTLKSLTLKPCPFCGNDNDLWLDVDEDFIHCGTCNVYGPDRQIDHEGYAAETAHEAWNRRAQPEPAAAQPGGKGEL